MLNLPFCKDCNKRLGDYRSTFCESCSHKSKNTNFRQCVNGGSFKKGIVPWNKGLKGLRPWNKGLTKESDPRIDYIRPTVFKSFGKSSESELVRKSAKMKMWKRSVLERDNYTCQTCKRIGGKLHADHIKSFAIFPEHRFSLDNGRTLCVGCHKMFGWKVSHIKK